MYMYLLLSYSALSNLQTRHVHGEICCPDIGWTRTITTSDLVETVCHQYMSSVGYFVFFRPSSIACIVISTKM